MDIVFTNTLNIETDVIEPPRPALASIPQWYKDNKPWITGKREPNPDNKSANATIKKCMPVFDVMTAGYIITTPCDVWVKQVNNVPYYQWVAFDAISFHPIEQTVGHPATKDGLPSPKWMNPWGIKTPKGWSSLFITPSHRDLPFTILPGIVDTDNYFNPVNFPFRLNDNSFEGMIPAGTPMAQVIPIKRDSWKMSLGDDKEIKQINTILQKMNTVFFDRYKQFWWNRKEYR